MFAQKAMYHTHTRTRARTHARTHEHTRTHAHIHTRARAQLEYLEVGLRLRRNVLLLKEMRSGERFATAETVLQLKTLH